MGAAAADEVVGESKSAAVAAAATMAACFLQSAPNIDNGHDDDDDDDDAGSRDEMLWSTLSWFGCRCGAARKQVVETWGRCRRRVVVVVLPSLRANVQLHGPAAAARSSIWGCRSCGNNNGGSKARVDDDDAAFIVLVENDKGY
jgi:hypothetical protein